MLQKQTKQYADGEQKWWENLFGNLGGILTGAGNLAGGITGNRPLQPADTTNYYKGEDATQKSNAGLYVILGVVGIAVVAAIIMLTRKK